MKIYTKTGDLGQTSLMGGGRVSKNDPRVDAYGTVDELNAWIGLLRDQEQLIIHPLGTDLVPMKDIQEILFVIGSQLASDPSAENKFIPEFSPLDISRLETSMDWMDTQIPELKHFILPGGHPSVSFLHITRNVCRRAERLVSALEDLGSRRPLILVYLNRLSDYLFVLSRYWAQGLGVEEYKWIPNPRG